MTIASVTIFTKFMVHRQAKEPARGPSPDTAAVTLGSALLILIIDRVWDDLRRRTNQSVVIIREPLLRGRRRGRRLPS